MSALLDGMNPRQAAAISAGTGPVLVLAGPGSGKTRVLTHRIAYLIDEQRVPPHQLLAVTFTNKAAAEMRGRVDRLLNGRLHGLRIGTFHSICARLLRREADSLPYSADFLIFDTDDQMTVVEQTLRELNIDSKRHSPRAVLSAISSAKNELVGPKEYVGYDYFGEVVARAYPRYQEILLDNNAMDFDDLLMQMVLLLRGDAHVRDKYQRLFEYVLVDEFQDTNSAQYELVRLMGAPQQNVFAVGDEDQAIYAFRGADYRNVLRFREDYPDAQVILLEQNYRSPQVVLDAARAVIDQNPHRTPKALFTTRKDGVRLSIYEAYSEEYEADYIIDQIESLRKRQKHEYRDFAVMYRTNVQSRALEDRFIKRGVPYKLVGGVGFYKRIEVRDMLAFLRLIHNPNDSVSFTRIINVPKRGIGKKSLQDFQGWAARNELPYGAALQRMVEGEPSPLTGRAAAQFIEFGRLLARWREIAAKGDLLELYEDVVSTLGYSLYLQEISDSIEQMREREDNMAELHGILERSREVPLGEFLAEIALVADVDTLKDDVEAVTLLTLHAAKGLEYPVVFIAGLEEGLLPHMRALDEPDGMSEERRLLYVGITRAMEQLYLTYAFRRQMWGRSEAKDPSRFLFDIPGDLTDGLPTALQGKGRGAGAAARTLAETRWDSPATKKTPPWEHPLDRWLREREQAAADDTDTPDAPPDPAQREKAAKLRAKIRAFGADAETGTPLKYRTGMRVKHSKYGMGKVISSLRSGDDEEVTVLFDDKKAGLKKLLASYGGLTIVE